MKRGKPLVRTPFKPRVYERAPTGRQWEGGAITPRAVPQPVVRPIAALFRPMPKENVIEEHAAYMAIVRTMACAWCGIRGFTQFCHSDEGKGMGLKTDCRRGWPGCGPHNGEPGCHWYIGTSGVLGREARRTFEARASRRTRELVIRSGKWPASLPRWPE